MKNYERTAEDIAENLQQTGEYRDDQIPSAIGAGIIYALLAIVRAINNK